MDECVLTNNRRLFYLADIAIPLRIINILLFLSTDSNDMRVLKIWERGIIYSHLTLLILMIVALLLSMKYRKRTVPNKRMRVLQIFTVVVTLLTGVVIVTFDQLVTTSITPFMLTCIVIGLVFLIRPIVSFIMYLIVYLIYYFMISLTISNPQVLLSNRVNGITAVALGLFISIVLWNYNYFYITQKRCIENQKRQLEQMAYYDCLTDLPNRRFIDKIIEQELSFIKLKGHSSVLVLLDIDNFKVINDTYGHMAGDQVLRQLAKLLKENIRETDTVSRFGGEEFVILMPNTSLEEGYELTERLRKQVVKEKFTINSIEINVTASFGVSRLWNPNEYYSLADKALYLAKQRGKNRVEVMEGKHES